MISYQDFQKLDMRIGRILKVEDVPKADNLYKIDVEIGSEQRTIVAGMKPYYSKEEMVGLDIVVLTNLEPRKIRGIKSEGMLLAASTPEHEEVVLLTTHKKIPSGSQIS